jgi:hypothetical protein
MSFLDKAKQTANNIKTKPTLPGVPPKPPTLNKPTIPEKPTIPGKPKLPVTAPKVEEKTTVEENKETEKKTTPLTAKKENPFILKGKSPEIPEIKGEKKISDETTSEEKDIKEELAVKEETVSAEEVKVTEQKTKKKRTSKKKEEKVKEEIAETEPKELVIPSTEVSFEEAINSIRSGFIDEQWEKFKAESKERINGIVIKNSMTTSMIKETLADLSEFRDSIWSEYADTKTLFENLSGKDPEGVIERIKRMSVKGSNAEERKLNSVLAIINYKDKEGRAINLYEVLDESRERFNYLYSLMKQIEYKNSALVTMLGSIKSEK